MLLQSWCQIYGEARILSYTPICASGPKAAVLHTGHAGAPNDRVMGDGELMLNDMGCEVRMSVVVVWIHLGMWGLASGEVSD